MEIHIHIYIYLQYISYICIQECSYKYHIFKVPHWTYNKFSIGFHYTSENTQSYYILTPLKDFL